MLATLGFARLDEGTPAPAPTEAPALAYNHPPPPPPPTAISAPPPPARERGERSKEAEKRLAAAATLGAHGSVMQNPCVDTAPDGACRRTALEPLFARLDDLHEGNATSSAQVAVLGNSLIASDHIVDVVRTRLVERFGSGGKGFLLADRIADYGPRSRTGTAPAGAFNKHNFSMGERGQYPFGLAGVLHVSATRGARTTWPVDGEASARLFWLDHGKAPSFSLRADGMELARVEPTGHEAGKQIEVVLPAATRRLELVADGPGAVVYGARLLNDPAVRPGVIVDTFGVPAADAGHFYQRSRADLFVGQLQALAPNLVVVVLGGNEAKRLDWKKTTRERIEEQSHALLARVHEGAVDAGCLVVGPIDAVRGNGNNPWVTRPHLAWVNEMWRWTAVEHGCAFFDLLGAMGGPGALKRFAQRGLVHEDLVHPRDPGLAMLGEMLADALPDAYASTTRSTTTAVATRDAD